MMKLSKYCEGFLTKLDALETRYHLTICSVRVSVSICFTSSVSILSILSQSSLLSLVYKAQGKLVDAYNTCSFVLLHLGETIPDSVTSEDAKTMVEDTLKMYEEVYDDDWLERRMEDENLQIVVKFYSCLLYTSPSPRD